VQPDAETERAAATGATPDQEHRGIAALLAGASLELSSRDPAYIVACAGLLKSGTFVYISMPR